MDLPGIPLFPPVVDYPRWAAGLRGLGARHTAQALLPVGVLGGFKVLDGLWFRTRGMRWQRVDRTYVAGWRRAGHGAVDALADVIDAALTGDPMAVRHVTLYELAVLLEGEPRGRRAQAAEALGVDAAEAPVLAAAVTSALPPGGLDREAAEAIQDAWARRRVRRAAELAGRLPAHPSDTRLRGLLAAVADAVRATDCLLREADHLAATGAPVEAAARYCSAARLATDDPLPITGLLRTAPAPAPPALTATPIPEGVRLAWAAAAGTAGTAADPADPADPADCADSASGGGGGRWHVVRYPVGRPEERVRVGVAADGGGFVDTTAVTGSRVSYAVLPVRGGLITGPPRTGAPLLIAPEVTGLTFTAGRDGMTATWQAPADAVAVRAVRLGEPDEELDAQRGGFTDPAVPAGRHTYRVTCDYRAPDGSLVTSAGLRADAVAEEWPDEVAALTAEPHRGAVRWCWTAPEHGDVLLVPWNGPPPAPGIDLSAELPSLPAPLTGAPLTGVGTAGVETAVPPGTSLRVTAVSVLGRRAVAGPSLLVAAPAPVTALTAQRLPDDELRIAFDWPESAATVLVGWEQAGVTAERRLTRSGYLRGGLRLPATGAACTVTVRVEPVPGADLVLGAATRTTVPPQVRVGYRLTKPAWRTGARRTVVVSAVLPARPPGAPGESRPGCPDFLLVGRETLAPLRPEQGREEVRLDGARLESGEPVQVELDLRGRTRPYLLRGFLLGAYAPGARLDHPTPDTLVVP